MKIVERTDGRNSCLVYKSKLLSIYGKDKNELLDVLILLLDANNYIIDVNMIPYYIHSNIVVFPFKRTTDFKNANLISTRVNLYDENKLKFIELSQTGEFETKVIISDNSFGLKTIKIEFPKISKDDIYICTEAELDAELNISKLTIIGEKERTTKLGSKRITTLCNIITPDMIFSDIPYEILLNKKILSGLLYYDPNTKNKKKLKTNQARNHF